MLLIYKILKALKADNLTMIIFNTFFGKNKQILKIIEIEIQGK